jgi:hypothetical protein
MCVQVKGVSPQRHGNPEPGKGELECELGLTRHGLIKS